MLHTLAQTRKQQGSIAELGPAVDPIDVAVADVAADNVADCIANGSEQAFDDTGCCCSADAADADAADAVVADRIEHLELVRSMTSNRLQMTIRRHWEQVWEAQTGSACHTCLHHIGHRRRCRN